MQRTDSRNREQFVKKAPVYGDDFAKVSYGIAKAGVTLLIGVSLWAAWDYTSNYMNGRKQPERVSACFPWEKLQRDKCVRLFFPVKRFDVK